MTLKSNKYVIPVIYVIHNQLLYKTIFDSILSPNYE